MIQHLQKEYLIEPARVFEVLPCMATLRKQVKISQTCGSGNAI
jgi:hypothetical protein